MHTLFEYGKKVEIKDREGLEEYLCLLWEDYKNLWTDDDAEGFENKNNYQPFLSFDGEIAKANNFVGFINSTLR